jgi:hypothetical protein
MSVATNLEGTRNQREPQPPNNEDDMSTTTSRSKSVIAVLALALGAILLALCAPAALAAPDDGTGKTLPTPPQIQASSNPVFFQPFDTEKWIHVSWKPYQAAAVRVVVAEDGGPPVEGSITFPNVPDPGGPFGVKYGKTYEVHLETFSFDNSVPVVAGPTLTITTARREAATPQPVPQPQPLPLPQPPEITPRSIPNLPGLTLGGTPR